MKSDAVPMIAPNSSNYGLQRIACYSFGRAGSVVLVKVSGLSASAANSARDR